MGRKRKDEGVTIEVFKTTIGFRGLAKDFVLELGNNKSSVINSLIIGAIKDGTMEEQLIRVLTVEKVKALKEKYMIGSQQTAVVVNKTNEITHSKKGDNDNGFDF